MLDMVTREADPTPGAEISGGQTQEQINQLMGDNRAIPGGVHRAGKSNRGARHSH